MVTSYSSIDRQPLDRDLYRKLAKGERTMIRDLVDYAAQVANGMLVPEGFPSDAWRDLDPASRFYVRMLDVEAKGSALLEEIAFWDGDKFLDWQLISGGRAGPTSRLLRGACAPAVAGAQLA